MCEPAEDAEGVEYVGTKDGYAVYEVGSGSYLFSVSKTMTDGIRNVNVNGNNNNNLGMVYDLSGRRIYSEVNGNNAQLVIKNGHVVSIK